MDLLTFVARLAKWQAHAEAGNKRALERAALLVEREAKSALGSYRYGWPRLSPATIARKATGDSPGLETGGMRDSIEHTVYDGNTADVGSNDDKLLWFEFGTAKQPPRPLLERAAQEKEAEVAKILGGGALEMLEIKTD